MRKCGTKPPGFEGMTGTPLVRRIISGFIRRTRVDTLRSVPASEANERRASDPPLTSIDSMTPQRAITWRSVLIGLAGVVLICALTPYNDYALNNTFLVGNNLPVG